MPNGILLLCLCVEVDSHLSKTRETLPSMYVDAVLLCCKIKSCF